MNGHQKCSPAERTMLTWFEQHPGATATEALRHFGRSLPRTTIESLLSKGVLVAGPSSGRANRLYSRAQRDAAFALASIFPMSSEAR